MLFALQTADTLFIFCLFCFGTVENNLGGTIQPETLSFFPQLETLDLFTNSIAGPLPSIAGLSSLVLADFEANQFTGFGFEGLGATPVPLLTSYRVSTNRLRGTIPISIANATGLKELWFARNLVTGTIPIEIGDLTNLGTYTLHISSWFCTQRPLTLFWFFCSCKCRTSFHARKPLVRKNPYPARQSDQTARIVCVQQHVVGFHSTGHIRVCKPNAASVAKQCVVRGHSGWQGGNGIDRPVVGKEHACGNVASLFGVDNSPP